LATVSYSLCSLSWPKTLLLTPFLGFTRFQRVWVLWVCRELGKVVCTWHRHVNKHSVCGQIGIPLDPFQKVL
jgi:hypothetical protein